MNEEKKRLERILRKFIYELRRRLQLLERQNAIEMRLEREAKLRAVAAKIRQVRIAYEKHECGEMIEKKEKALFDLLNPPPEPPPNGNGQLPGVIPYDVFKAFWTDRDRRRRAA